ANHLLSFLTNAPYEKKKLRKSAGFFCCLRGRILFCQPVKKELFNWFVFGSNHMAPGMTGGKVAEFFRHVLDVVTAALQRIGHGEYMQALGAFESFSIFSMADNNQ